MDSKELQEGDVSVEREYRCCVKCLEWEEKCKQSEERFTELKSEFEAKISELRFLQDKLCELGGEKLLIQDQVEYLNKRNEDVEQKVASSGNVSISIGEVRKQLEEVVDLNEDTENNKVLELMIENQVLECEKKKAESEVQVWKSRCKELESQVMESRVTSGVGEYVLNGMTGLGLKIYEVGREETNVAKGSQGGTTGAVTPLGDSNRNVTSLEEGKRGLPYKSRLEPGSQARKRLFFGEETSLSKKIAPATPAGATPASRNVIDIMDSDDEPDTSKLIVLNGQGKKQALELTNYQEGTSQHKKQFPSDDLTDILDQSEEDNVTFHGGTTPVSTFKRKRASKIVTSDSENDEDHFPISRLRTKSKMDATSSWDEDGEPVVRRRLVRLRNLKENISCEESPSNIKSRKTRSYCGIPTSFEEDESSTEGGSLDDFFASDDDISNGEGDRSSVDVSGCNGDSLGDLGDESDGEVNYGDIIARLGRHRGHELKWEFLADMQAALGKDPELCMKAVCALYRRQTSDEKFHKATIACNRQGFSQVDAYRGSKLGEFLTDGDPDGDLCKSVEELEKYDMKGVKKCRDLAMHYARQLFELYQSGEDPLWLPSESK